MAKYNFHNFIRVYSNVSNKKRAYINLTLILFLFLFWQMFCCPHLENKCIQFREKIKLLQADYNQIIIAQQNYNGLHKQIANEQLSLDKQIAEQKKYAQIFISNLIEKLTEKNLHFINYSFNKLSKKEWYKKNQLQLNALGELKNINLFFSDIHNLFLPISCDNFSIAKQDDNKYILQATLKYATYRKIKSLQLETS